MIFSAELASQTNMVGKAKQRVEQVEEQLHQARWVTSLDDQWWLRKLISLFIELTTRQRWKRPMMLKHLLRLPKTMPLKQLPRPALRTSTIFIRLSHRKLHLMDIRHHHRFMELNHRQKEPLQLLPPHHQTTIRKRKLRTQKLRKRAPNHRRRSHPTTITDNPNSNLQSSITTLAINWVVDRTFFFNCYFFICCKYLSWKFFR